MIIGGWEGFVYSALDLLITRFYNSNPQTKQKPIEVLSSLRGAASLFAMIKILSRSQNYNALNGKNYNCAPRPGGSCNNYWWDYISTFYLTGRD